MNDVDFSECRLIKEELCFLTYDEFCRYRKGIIKLFNQLSENGKLFYKYYIYANIHMKHTYKDAIWDYINIPNIKNEARLLKLKENYKPQFIR